MERVAWIPGVAIWRASEEVARATPPSRDRVVDFLRSASIAVVVLGHLIMAVVVWNGATPHVDNLLDAYAPLRIATWALQVMPLFFAAGAIANRRSWERAHERGELWRIWMWSRLRRLLRPVIYYLALWVPLVLVLEATVPDAASRLAGLSTQLLWFLGVYILVVATTPLQRRLAPYGLWSIAMLVALVAAIDTARFHVIEAADLANFIVVWFMAATFGLVVRDWRPDRRRQLIALGLGAMLVNVALIRLGPYPLSMVGLPSDRISNMAPPTLALAMHAIVVIALVGACWAPLERLCHRELPWHATCAVGGVAMTAYLWHLTALVIVTVLEHAIRLDRPAPHMPHFWLATVAHLGVLLVAVVVIVSIMAPLEWLPVPWLEGRRSAAPDHVMRAAAEVLGATLCGIALLVLAGTGMQGFPFGRVTRYAGLAFTPGLGMAMLAVGVLLTRAGGRPRVEPDRARAMIEG